MTKREALQAHNALVNEFLERLVYTSWTWERLTVAEQWSFEDLIADFPIFGTREQKFKTLNRAYHAFLLGAGYKAIGWRET